MNSTALKKSCYILIHKDFNIQCLRNYYEIFIRILNEF